MNWKSIIVTAVLTGFVTILTSMLLYWWQSERSELTFNSIQSIPFDASVNTVFIQQIEIKNSGKKPTKNVVLHAQFKNETIQRSKTLINETISYTDNVREKSILLDISSLNPGEEAVVSIMYQSDTLQSPGPTISLRADGVSGKEIGSEPTTAKKASFLSATSAVMGVLTGLSLVFLTLRKTNSGSQREVWASCFANLGYFEKAREYLKDYTKTTYWAQSDYLTAEALDGQGIKIKDCILVFEKVLNFQMAKSSQGIIHFNLARLKNHLEQDDESISENINQAIKLNTKEIETRLTEFNETLGKYLNI